MKAIQTILAILIALSNSYSFAQVPPTIDSISGGGLFYVGDSTVLNVYATGDLVFDTTLTYESWVDGSHISPDATLISPGFGGSNWSMSLNGLVAQTFSFYSVVKGAGGTDTSETMFITVAPQTLQVSFDSTVAWVDSAYSYARTINTYKYVSTNIGWLRVGKDYNLDSLSASQNVPLDTNQLVFKSYGLDAYTEYFQKAFAWNIQENIQSTPFDSFMTMSAVPQIDSLVLAVKTMGDTDSITVYGKNFVNGSIAAISGNAHGTTFVSDTLLKMEVLASDVDSLGSYPVTIFNPGGGGLSNGSEYTVICPISWISSTTVTNELVVGQNVIESFTANGLGLGQQWSVSLGALPSGQNLDLDSGIISGAPNVLGTSNYTLEVTDTFDCSASVNLSQVVICDTITVSGLMDGIAGFPYVDTVPVTGLNPITNILAIGNFPAGLNINGNGAASGTPTVITPAMNIFTLVANNAWGCQGTKVDTITITCPPAIWNSVIADTLYVGELGPEDTLKMFNGNPIANYSVSPGVTLGRSLDTATGIISGTPSVTGLINYIATGTDIFGCQSTDNVGQWVVCDSISLDTMTNVGVVGQPFGGSVQVSGTGSFTFSSAGQLPQTLSLDTLNGTFPGVLTAQSSSNFVITATNQYGCSGVGNYSVTAYCPGIIPVTDTLNTLVVGQASIDDTVNFTNSNPLYDFEVLGTMTPGRSLDTLTGIISGTPNTVGTYNWSVMRNDVYGCLALVNYTQIVVCDTPSISTVLVNDTIIVNQAPVDTPIVSGNGTFTWSVSQGALPNGRTIDPSTGIMSDTTDVKGTFNFTLKAMSQYGCSAEVNVTQVVICGTLTVSITLPDTIAEDVSDSGQVNISGGVSPYYYSVSGLPQGMNYNFATGAIYDTPSDSGTYVVSATVTDVKGCSGTAKDTVTIAKYYLVANGTVVLSSSSLMFSATVMNNNSATNSAWIYYGIGSNLNQQIMIGVIPSGTSPITETQIGLQANTKYCWQLHANNAVSPDTLCATTLEATPDVISAATSAITKTSALVTLVQNSGGGSATVVLYYYDNDSVSLGSPIVKTAVGTQNVLWSLNNLPAGDTVNFKIVETNSVGSDALYGSFVTLDYAIQVTNVFRTCTSNSIQLAMIYSSDDPLGQVWVGYEPDSVLTGAYQITIPEALPTGTNKQFVKVVSGLADTTEYAASFFIKRGNNAIFTTDTTVCLTPLGEEEIGKSNWFKIFPNPMSVFAEIASTDGVLVLQNALGAEIMKVKVVNGRGVIDRKNLPAGLYYHHLFDKDGIKRNTGKLLIE